MKKIIESTKLKRQSEAKMAAIHAAPFFAAFFLQYAQLFRASPGRKARSLFWSVFGPAAQYDFGNPPYAYAASMKQ